MTGIASPSVDQKMRRLEQAMTPREPIKSGLTLQPWREMTELKCSFRLVLQPLVPLTPALSERQLGTSPSEHGTFLRIHLVVSRPFCAAIGSCVRDLASKVQKLR